MPEDITVDFTLQNTGYSFRKISNLRLFRNGDKYKTMNLGAGNRTDWLFLFPERTY